MTIFIDTGFFIAYHNNRDINHNKAVELMKKLLKGEFGVAYTSDYVFDEAITVALARTGRGDLAKSLGQLILGEKKPKFVTMIKIDEGIFYQAWECFCEYLDRGLSFTDCTSLSLVESRGFDSILSFDRDFDGILSRIH